MGLFSSKPKYSIEEFCREFYDEDVFHKIGKKYASSINGVELLNVPAAFWEQFIKGLKESGDELNNLNEGVIHSELLALRLELFALAWSHTFKKDDYNLRQSIFTKQYLEDHGLATTWDDMTDYNSVVAKSKRYTGDGEPISKWDSLKIDKALLDWFGVQADKGYDPLCVARVANRMYVEMSKHNKIVLLFLTNKFNERLAIELSDRGTEQLAQTLYALYDISKQHIQNVKISS